jgi:uncharacterized membrane protein YeaQ/YmgE (transglycosylase-associated protein family)
MRQAANLGPYFCGSHKTTTLPYWWRNDMDAQGIIVWLIIGAIAGWLAGTLLRGGGFGLIGDIIVGIIGAVLGGWLAGVLGLHLASGLISAIITATVGAIVLILIVRVIKRA